MLINLKSEAAKAEPQNVKIELQERLPAYVAAPCVLDCQFKVSAEKNYYLITMDVDSIVSVICQRCLGEFHHHYTNQTTLAVCNSDEIAEKLMELYECVVSTNGQLELEELLTDELHLYVPESHLDIENCDQEINRFIQVDSIIKS
ncbi:TPA: metal-binding protein [Legionella feeleii]|uniref:Metal-binding protein n=1 Tax=Legionella feeleii TaxID=453 RepID=A0A0W0U4Y9_9GAMM|nr:metal-binding protein [Legionella feeleii]KTD02685.1 metal-binding protein [Legionella feeleii]SPX59757.1 metal-binding, possibly nucleic acid-binding protein [Legionella feeleii]STX38372.1 metal-binding, possibly nucleic acid-binding protein [Legionella feeleii]